MRERFCRQCRNWHDLEAWPFECMTVAQGAPSDALPVPFIASDTMEPVQSMLDGKMYTSKSQLRATYKAAGVIEVGNDPARLRQKPREKPDKQAIKNALDKAQARYDRGERAARRA